MKKIIISSILSLLVPTIVLAFTSATLFKGIDRVPVYTKAQADYWFAKDYKLEEKSNLGIAAGTPTVNFKWVQSQSYTLAGSGAVLGATTLTLKSFKQIDGTLLTISNFGIKGFGTIEPGSGSTEDQITFSGVTQNANGTATLTGVKSALNIYPYTETSGISYTHPGGVKFVLTNTAAFYNEFAQRSNDNTIDGLYTFASTSMPRLDDYKVPTNRYQLAPKGYVDDSIAGGGVPISEDTAGIGKIATKAQASDGVSSDGTYRYLLPSSMATTTSQVATTSIPITGTNGKLSDNFTDFTLNKTFSGDNFFNGTSTQATTTAAKLTVGTSTTATIYPGAYNTLTNGGDASALHTHNYSGLYFATTTNATYNFASYQGARQLIATTSIVGGTLGTAKAVRARINFSDFTPPGTLGYTGIFSAYYGGSYVNLTIPCNLVATNLAGYFDITMQGAETTGTQELTLSTFFSNGYFSATSSMMAVGNTSVDSSTAQDFTAYYRMSTVQNVSLTVANGTIEVLK